MNKDEIVAKVKNLNLVKGSFIVFGSCPLAVLGIRQAQDIDLLVTSSVLRTLKKAGWKKIDKGLNDQVLVDDVFEAHDSWKFGDYEATLKQLLGRAIDVDDVDFASIDDLRKWKLASARPKDLRDLKLLDKYLNNEV